MDGLTLYYHPLSSCCHKVLIAVDVLEIEVDKHLLNLGDPAECSAFEALCPTGKMPLLIDQERSIAETTIIIEYLQRYHARVDRTLVPDNFDEALEVRLWDRLFDLYVMTPMQALTADILRPENDRDPYGVVQARERLTSSYAMIELHLKGQKWMAGDAFSMADCAAAPALFFAVTYVPLLPQHICLTGYFDRLMDHSAVQRTIDQARPYFKYYPGRAGLSKRFHDP